MNYLYSTFDYIKNKTNDIKDKFYKINSYEIIDKIILIEKPEDINLFSNYLNTTYDIFYKIWNVSENKYDNNLFKGEVNNFISIGYPNLYLKDIYQICIDIRNWIDNSEKNIAIIHCNKNNKKSILVWSCILFYLKIKLHPLQAYDYIINLDINLNVLTNSNKLYLKYFSCFIENFKLNLNKVLIKNIKISHIPNINLLPDHKDNYILRKTPKYLPYLQIFQEKTIIFNDIDYIFTKKENEKLDYKINQTVEGEWLIRIKHFLSSDLRYEVFKLMINTGFLQQGINNFSSKDIDFGENISLEDYNSFFITLDVDILSDKSNNLILLDQLRNKLLEFAIIETENNNQNFEEVYSIGEDDDEEEVNKTNKNFEKINIIENKIDNNKEPKIKENKEISDKKIDTKSEDNNINNTNEIDEDEEEDREIDEYLKKLEEES